MSEQERLVSSDNESENRGENDTNTKLGHPQSGI